MAIETQYDFSVGIDLPSAYVRIIRYVVDITNNRTIIDIGIYASAQSRLDNKAFVEGKTVMVEGILDGLSSMYQHIKLLEIFNEAKDV